MSISKEKMSGLLKKRTLEFYKFIKYAYKNTNIENDFEFIKKLGSGVQGEVNLVTPKNKELKLPKYIAIKSVKISKKSFEKISNKPYSEEARKREEFIEFISMILTRELVLQKICPNFVLNYHVQTKKDESKYYITYFNEYIDGKTFDKWCLEKHDKYLWFNVLFQILVSLYSMYYHFDMVHNDFHGDNILYRKIKPGGYWLYKIDGRKYYVPNLGYQFYLSDFGYAWITGKMFPFWFVKEEANRYIVEDFDKLKFTDANRSYRDLKKLLKTTFKDKRILELLPYEIKHEFLIILAKMLSKRKNTFTFSEIIDNLYSCILTDPKSEYILEKKEGCYTKYNKSVLGKKIRGYDINKKINKEELPKELRDLVIN